MAVKNSELVAFFEQLARKHLKIAHSETNRHFYRMELDEFASGIGKFTGYNMLLEVMPIKYDGNNLDNCFKIREVGFLIIKSVTEITKINISAAFDECEEIMDDILSELQAARCGFNNTVITFDISSIDAHHVSDGKNFGVRCLVDVKSIHNFEVNPNNWSL